MKASSQVTNLKWRVTRGQLVLQPETWWLIIIIGWGKSRVPNPVRPTSAKLCGGSYGQLREAAGAFPRAPGEPIRAHVTVFRQQDYGASAYSEGRATGPSHVTSQRASVGRTDYRKSAFTRTRKKQGEHTSTTHV